ncbi:PH domain-like [Phytophthora cactorum]|nr:PH domain-like [Phytophthora cactorum]
MISDGTNNFRAWRARVENELMRHGLLEYVLVQGYNGSQSFNYNGQLVEAKYPDGLRQFYTVKEAAEAMHIVQCSLHEDIVAAVLNKNVFGVWSTLRALYESGKDSTIAEKYRVLDHMWYGDKEACTAQEVEIYGNGSRPFIPVTELKEKAIAEEKLRCNSSDPAKKSVPANARNKSLSSQPRENTTSKSFRDLSSARTVREEFCFYCFKGNHTFPQCKYLRNDINTGNTHNNRSQFSCRATEKRTSTMVQELEAAFSPVCGEELLVSCATAARRSLATEAGKNVFPRRAQQPMETSIGSSVRVFDGTTDFRVWRARVENELMRYHLLGYVMVRGSQSFTYNGEEVPPRTPVIHVDEEQQQSMIKEEISCGRNSTAMQRGRLSRWDVLGESAEAKGILQRYLHPDVESAILNKNIYDSWKMLCALYDNRSNPGAHDVYEMHRVLHHIRLGDKKGEPVREFITRWEMLMQQYGLATGIELTDAFRSVSLTQTLPSAWRPMVASWRGIRPVVPYAELVEKVVATRERMQAQTDTATVPNTTLVKATSNSGNSSTDVQTSHLAEKSTDKPAAVKPVAQPISKPPEKAVDNSASKTAEKQTPKPVSKPAEKQVEKPVEQRAAEATTANPNKAVPPPIDVTTGADNTVDLTSGEISTSSAKSKSPASTRSRDSNKKTLTERTDKAATPRSSKSPKTDDDRYEKSDSYDKRHQHDKYDSERGYDKYASHTRYEKSPRKPRSRYEKKYDSYDRFDNSGLVSCFYCLKVGHHMKRCWYLKADIENGTTHDVHKKFSCAVTIDRNQYMVHCLESYIDEVNRERATYRASMSKTTAPRSHGDYNVSESVGRNYRSQQQEFMPPPPPGQPPAYAFREQQQQQSSSATATADYRKRSHSVFQAAESRVSSRDPRLNRSNSVYRSTDVAEDFSPRKRARAPPDRGGLPKGIELSGASKRRRDLCEATGKEERKLSGRRQSGKKAALELGRDGAWPSGAMKKTTLWRNNSTMSNSDNGGSTTTTATTTTKTAKTTNSSSNSSNAAHNSSRGSRGSRGSRRSTGSATPEGDDKLPPGWTRKESKSQKGRYYFISPAGKTHEVEICFQEGRLGVSLREVHQMETILYPQFQAEVDDLPKINGKAGPAELHNWSVKPHKRLTIGMRVISIEDTSLAGLTYKEVVAKLKSASRPVRIKFADVQKGTVEENGGRKSDGDKANNGAANDPAAAGYGHSTAYMQQKQEYTRVLVTGELHTEMWTIENKKMLRSLTRMQHKWSTVSVMMKNLKLQATYAMENPELVRANELAKRNTELNDDISKMSSGNKRLRKERDALQAQLDELEKQLAKVEQKDKDEEEDRVPEEDIFGIEPTAPPKEQLSALKKKRRGLEDELNKEQRKANKVQKEMEQLTKHYASLGTEETGLSSSTSSSSSSHQSQADDKDKAALSASGHHEKMSSSNGTSKPKSEFADLEAKILELRKKQRSVVDTLSKAAQSGDHKLAKECQRRRQKIKEELKEAQDELHRLKTKGKSGTSSSRGDSRKQKTSAESSTDSSHQHSSSDKGPTEWADRGIISGMKTMRGARERWCVITSDGFLKYYKRRGDSVVRGEINLAERSFEVVCEDLRHGKEFVLSTDEQQSHFFTKSPQELNNWQASQ